MQTLLDPACGTGGMLSVAEDHLRELNPRRAPRGLRPGAERRDLRHLRLRHDAQGPGRHPTSSSATPSPRTATQGARFDYLLANPPFGVEWKKVERRRSATRPTTKGFDGRFGAGLPRINDGSFLFLQHMISKMKPAEEGGSRLAIVFNGSPLFTGGAGSGETEIRRWIIENDWLEAIVALPDQLFYNTGISTYVWIVTNRKAPERRGKVQLIDARELFEKMRKSLGEKRKEISAEQIDEITRLYGDFAEGERGQDLPQRGVRLPAHHRRAAAPPPLGGHRRDARRPRRRQEGRQARRRPTRAAVHAELERSAGEAHCGRVRSPPRSSGFCSTDAGRQRQAAADRRLDALAVRDPDAAGHPTEGQAEPDPDLRDNENVPLPTSASRFEADADRSARNARVPHSRRRLHRAEVLPVRPRRVGRPRQDQDRLRDPPDPPLLQVRPAAPACRDRRRDQGARSTRSSELLSEVTE